MIRKGLRECVSYLKSNTLFRKTITYYVITGCIIFFLFGIVTVFTISNASSKQLNATEQKMLSQSCNTANQILRDIHSLCNSKYTDESSIMAAMTTDYSTKNSMNLQNTFAQIMASSTLIDSMYVFNFKDNVVYSTQTIAKPVDEFIDKNIIDYLNNNPPKTDIFFSRIAELDIDPLNKYSMDYITSVYRNSKDYAFVVNIDQNEFQQMVNLTSNDDSYSTVVLDADGNVISHSKPEYFAQNMSDDPIFSEILNSHQPNGSFKADGMAVNYVRSDILGYVYASFSAALNPFESFTSLLIYILLFMLLLIISYIICGIYASMSTYSLFNNLKNNIYALFKKDDTEIDGSDSSDEIENISKLLRDVKTSYNSMETLRYKYINTKQNDVLKKLLTGIYPYLNEDMKDCDITFPYSGFAVVIMRIDDLSRMDIDNIYTIKYALMNMGTEIFENCSNAYAVEIGEHDVGFILNFMSDGFIKSSIDKLNMYLKKFFDATVSAAYDSAITESPDDLPELYHNAVHALSYRIVSGRTSITAYADIRDLDNAISSYPEKLEQDILKSITAQDDMKISENVNLFIAKLRQVSYNMLILYTDRLLLAIDQFAIRSKLSEKTDSAVNIREFISSVNSLDDIRYYIMSKCNDLKLKLSNIKLDSKKDIMVKTVLNYIENNFTDPNLSIDMIAGEINRSANYTRNIFKQSQGISISDYIAKKRFDEFCRLLRETNLTALEIGSRIGLNASGSYFYTAFKKYTGYTPDQYRKMHHIQ